MDTTPLLFQMMKMRMAYNGQRQAVLAHNIAQHAMPGAESRDLKPLNFSQLADQASGKLALQTTNSAHQRPGLTNGPYKIETLRKPFETSITNSSISLEEEQRKMSENAMQYQLATTLYSKHMAMMKTATGAR